MPGLVLRIAGPVQTWAQYRVGPEHASTLPVPSKTAVAGLLGASLGTKDYKSLVSAFDLDVRVDRANPVDTDFQVASDVRPADMERAVRAEKIRAVKARVPPFKVTGALPGVYERDFLPHAEFLVRIGGSEEFVRRTHAAVRAPAYLTYLGRRGNAPTFPLVLGIAAMEAGELFESAPYVLHHDTREPVPLRCYRIDPDIATLPDPIYAAAPGVTNREEYLSWFSQHLSR